MAYDKPVFPSQPAAWKPLAIFVAVGPPVFAAGALLGSRAASAGITAVVFDRGGNKYAGRVAAVADGAREGGLSF